MKTIKTVFKKIAEDKVELASERIELSLIDEVKDAVKRGRQVQKDLKSELNKYNGLLRAGGIMNKKLEEVEKIAKELGVKPPDEFKRFQEMANEMIKQGNAIKKVYNTL